MTHSLNLEMIEGTYAVVRLDPDEAVPTWARGGALWSITQTPEELSIICTSDRVPPGPRTEGPFRALKIKGTMDFALTGILAAIADPLAAAQISIFSISTFDTDYILVRNTDLGKALESLRNAGHQIE